jgi:hypothetical protein
MQKQVVKNGDVPLQCYPDPVYDKPVFLHTAMLLSFLRLQHAHQIIAVPAWGNYYFLKDEIREDGS